MIKQQQSEKRILAVRYIFFVACCFLNYFTAGSSNSAEFKVSKNVSSPVYTIELSGEIRAGDDKLFREQISTLPPLFGVVLLSSPGGDLGSALIIGREIKVRAFSTAVKSGEVCASACALIWLAGDTRYMSPDSKIGFHAAYTQQYERKLEKGLPNALIGAYLNRLKLSENAVQYITRPDPNSIQWLTIRDSMTLGINVTTTSELSLQ